MERTTSDKLDRVAAFCAMIWFAFIIDACYTWPLSWNMRLLIADPFVFYATYLLHINGRTIINKKRRTLIIIFLCLMLFLMITKMRVFSSPLKFLPFICLFTWDNKALLKLYDYFKTFIVFYAILSIFVEILVITNSWRSLPSITLPPQDEVQENHGIINHFFGLFVIPESSRELIFYRAMGPLREGGHFSIYLGFVYFVEKNVFNKRNLWVITAGLLTLSPNFAIFAIISEMNAAIRNRQILKSIGVVIIFVLVIFTAILFSPDFIKDEIIRIILERSLEENVENAQSDGFMALLDGRANVTGLQMWYKFSHSGIVTRFFGISDNDIKDGYTLSDIRFMILRYGYCGFSLFMLCAIKISFWGKKRLYGLCVLLLCLLVVLTRSWMFESLYIYTMMLLAVNTNCVYTERPRCIPPLLSKKK